METGPDILSDGRKPEVFRLTIWKQVKIVILLTHRYVGLLLSIGFLIWFLSGFVMMYKDFPSLSRQKDLAIRTPLDGEAVRVPPSLITGSSTEAALSTVRLGMILDRPVYRIQYADGRHEACYADTGERVILDEALTLRIVKSMGLTADTEHYSADRQPERDQWTPTARYLPHLPLFRVNLKDKSGTTLYLSSTTGEVLQLLNATDRFWAWIGPIPHWIYLRDLRVRDNLWRQIVIWVSTAGVVMSVSGLALGVIRYRRRAGGWNFSPYRKNWFRWHHYTGFIFGMFVFTWILSGLLSMNPMRWSPSRSLTDTETLRWQGGSLKLNDFRITPSEAVTALNAFGPVREIRMTMFQGLPYYQAWYTADQTRLLAADGNNACPTDGLSEVELLAAIERVNPAPIIERHLLTDYDAYYYSKGRTKRLPVLRVKLGDEQRTWYYVDPRTATIVERYETTSRLNRWLYHGLHSLDFSFLLRYRPLWDIVVLGLMIGGTVSSATGVALLLLWAKRKM